MLPAASTAYSPSRTADSRLADPIGQATLDCCPTVGPEAFPSGRQQLTDPSRFTPICVRPPATQPGIAYELAPVQERAELNGNSNGLRTPVAATPAGTVWLRGCAAGGQHEGIPRPEIRQRWLGTRRRTGPHVRYEGDPKLLPAIQPGLGAIGPPASVPTNTASKEHQGCESGCSRVRVGCLKG